MSEDGVVVTLVNQESSEDLDLPQQFNKGVLDRTIEEEDGSVSEGDIEIEHLVEVEDGTENRGGGDDEEIQTLPVANITFDVRKRTLIMLWQRTILEEFYRSGMTSASMQLHSLHQAAAEKTGLDHTVVKNWIRNRRRPAAVKSAEKLVEKMNHVEPSAYSSSSFNSNSSLASLVSSIHPPSSVTVATLVPSVPHVLGRSHSFVTTSSLVSNVGSGGLLNQQGGGVPDPKRICLDNSSVTTSPRHHFPQSTPSTPSLLSLAQPHINPPSLLVKIRVSNSGESDFYEVELPSMTYETLVKACAEELEVEVSRIAKIRKLPNILIRKDRDVQRLKNGQELEIVLKELNIASFGSNTGLSLLNVPLTSDASLISGSGITGGIGLHQTPNQHVNGLH